MCYLYRPCLRPVGLVTQGQLKKADCAAVIKTFPLATFAFSFALSSFIWIFIFPWSFPLYIWTFYAYRYTYRHGDLQTRWELERIVYQCFWILNCHKKGNYVLLSPFLQVGRKRRVCPRNIFGKHECSDEIICFYFIYFAKKRSKILIGFYFNQIVIL